MRQLEGFFSVRSLSGGRFAAFVLLFTVLSGCAHPPKPGPVSWKSAYVFDIPANDTSALSAAINPRGEVQFVYRDKYDGQPAVKASKGAPDGQPSPLMVLGAFPDSNIWPLLQSINQKGDQAIVAFVKSPKEYKVFLWHKGPEREWVNTDHYTRQTFTVGESVRLASADMDQDGNLLIACSDNQQIGATFCRMGVLCEFIPAIPTGLFQLDFFDARFDMEGNAHLIWAGGEGIFASRLMMTGKDRQWSDPQLLGNSSGPHFALPAIATSAKGFFVSWVASKSRRAEIIQARFFSPDTGWSDLHQPHSAVQQPPVLVVGYDDHGNAITAWTEELNPSDPGDDQSAIYAVQYQGKEGKWGPKFRIDDETTSQSPRVPRLVMGSEGEALIVWHDEQELTWAKARQYDPAHGWGLVTPIPRSLAECWRKDQLLPLAAGRDLVLAYTEYGCPGITVLWQQPRSESTSRDTAVR